LDQGLLAELLGRAELRELLDPDVLAEVEAELQRLELGDEDRRARDPEGLVDVIRTIGPLSRDEAAARCRSDADEALALLAGARRIVEVRVAGEPRWAVVEDVARLRDGLGVPVPPGTPDAFADPVEDPLGDLIARYARTHGPFTTAEVAERWGLGVAVARQTLVRLATAGRMLEGEFRPAGSGSEWCDPEVLRKLRRRSLARLRHEVEPVDPATLGRFLPAWQQVAGAGSARGLRGPDGVLAVVEQLAGCAVPASAWESLVLPSRVVDYQPAYLDELTTAGEVLWAGHGGITGADGWVSLHLADSAPLTLPSLDDLVVTDEHRAVLDALGGGGAFFFRQLGNQLAHSDDAALTALVWELVWAGLVGNDTLAPLRALTNSGKASHRARRTPPRARVGNTRTGARTSARGLGRPPAVTRSGPAEMAGRWFLLPEPEADPTRRAHAAAEGLLDRHGVVTRGAVMSERTPGGFAAAYRVLATFEESGRARRGYFVEGLGAAQFGTAGSIDRLRTFTPSGAEEKATGITLAATDPANPYGAALPWPSSTGSEDGKGHRPGRKAGAIVVLVDGALGLYVERGGRTLLTFSEDESVTAAAVESLGTTVRRGALGKLTVEKADGANILGAESEQLRAALEAAGFVATSRGLRIRA
jgi:ATP-dependent Lhr-like helicase